MRRIKPITWIIVSLLIVAGLVISFFAFIPKTSATGNGAGPGNYQSSNGSGSYQQNNLVSDISGKAKVTDAHLHNPWGITSGSNTPLWIANNGTGVSTLYNGQGQPFPTGSPLVVTIPPPKGGTSLATPTGVVFNGTNSFTVTKNSTTDPALFIFATEDGTISAWSPKVDQTHAILMVDKSNGGNGAVYKGLALDGNRLFATNFRAGVVEIFDQNFHQVGTFTDKNVPTGYAPFGIQNIGGLLYVTFAQQNAQKHDDVAGPGHGFVDVFTINGQLKTHLVSRGELSSPWGLALAPVNFGSFSNDLLVGNFGNGRINAYNPSTGAFLGTLSNQQGQPIVNEDLWGLTFGNGAQAGNSNTLFFTAGTNVEQDGLFGTIQSVN